MAENLIFRIKNIEIQNPSLPRHKLRRAHTVGTEGRKVVKGQFQPHAVVTDPPPLSPPSRPPFAFSSFSTRILFLRPPPTPPPTRRAEPQFDTDAPFEFRIQSAGADLCSVSAKLRVARELIARLGGMCARTMCACARFTSCRRHTLAKSP